MSALRWTEEFRTVYAAAKKSYGQGADSPDAMFDSEAKAFLSSIGCSPRELFDLVEDGCRFGEPDFATSLELADIRRDYFLNTQKGVASVHPIDMDRLPPKSARLAGIRWLPRIIEKARAKLRGEMPEELMYCCGGDRDFLRGAGMTAAEFLRLVRDCGDDTERVVAAVVQKAGRRA
ncbi:MAG: DUF5069 domain-containing protein [Verrucomicrobia bacterium]|nr:DUF5069 domain-containing protein [Verrucomicrobiota bacterium]